MSFENLDWTVHPYEAEVEPERSAEVKAEIERIKADQRPRCGTCGAACDPQNSDEGYSHCCNDRIEYESEWLMKPERIAEWAEDRLAWHRDTQ